MKLAQPHDSMRGHFFWHLYDEMEANKDIVLICVDLGYGAADSLRDDFPDQVIITGASEQAAMGMAVGLALSGKIPLIYSITPFLLWRPAETIRLYVNNENVNVKLIGSGRDGDYSDPPKGHDGFSHDAKDAKQFLRQFPNIVQYWPGEDGFSDVGHQLKLMLQNNKPSFMSLKRSW